MGVIEEHFTGDIDENIKSLTRWFGIMKIIHYDEESGGIYLSDQEGFLSTRDEIEELRILANKFFDCHGDDHVVKHNRKRYEEISNPSERTTIKIPKKKNRSGWVYLLKGKDDLYKIGMTNREPNQRLAEFSPKLPFESSLICKIKCDDAIALEAEIHAHFIEKRVRGEWFALNRGDVHWFCKLSFQKRYTLILP